MLVVDASVAVAACHSPVGFARLRGNELVAPQLMLVEASSVLHEMAWRKEISAERSRTMLDRLLEAPVEVRTPGGLIEAAWYVADELGWAKTYDAQYVALAQILACKLVSVDERLLRGVARVSTSPFGHVIYSRTPQTTVMGDTGLGTATRVPGEPYLP